LYCAEAGCGPLVVLLHGFPEFWYSWRHQLPVLAGAGFHCLAPDLRGYHFSSKPLSVRAYRIEALVDDVLRLVRFFGQRRAVIVGHDWGGVLAWHLAAIHPDCVERLVILNAPHPAAYLRELRRAEQLKKSWYVFIFQLPFLPECLIRANDFELVERMFLNEPVRPGAFTQEDVRQYKEALKVPGALTAALNYYRAAFRGGLRLDPRLHRPLQVPTLVVWGERDPYLSQRLIQSLDFWVSNVRIERLPDVSHWVQNEAPQKVNRLLLDFLN
jgi:pimeloyl-ACP methyl ester carboxylesterase